MTPDIWIPSRYENVAPIPLGERIWQVKLRIISIVDDKQPRLFELGYPMLPGTLCGFQTANLSNLRERIPYCLNGCSMYSKNSSIPERIFISNGYRYYIVLKAIPVLVIPGKF